jgi:hypothetical protein
MSALRLLYSPADEQGKNTGSRAGDGAAAIAA